MASILRKNIGWLAIVILSLLPVIRWAMIIPLNYRFFDLTMTMTSVGQITGLVGMAMFSISMMLSGRERFLDMNFGLDKVYKNHHVVGAFSFTLLLFHPLFLAVKYIQFSLRDAALFFLSSDNWALNYGILSLFLMIVLMVLTFYIVFRYQYWKFFHKFMVVVFVFAMYHTFYISSDISRDDILRIYVLSLAALGFSFGFYRAFLSRFFDEKYQYVIKKAIEIAPGVMQIDMEPKNRALSFNPGQFIFIKFIGKSISLEEHPFSISSAPSLNNLQLIIKSLGDYTNELKNLKEGDMALVEGPFGRLSYLNIENKNQIWIGGGVGITPFLSMARSLKNDGYKIDLYYSVKIKEEIVFLDELSNMSAVDKNFRVIPWYANEKGYLSASAIYELSGGLRDKDIFLCGPPVFMDSLRGQFRKLGVKKGKIHLEKFNFI